MTKDPVLLPEESVICGCKQDKGGILLTSDGWLAEEVSARFEGLTRLHRLLHLSKVESLHPLEVRKQNGIAGWAMMACLMLTGAFCLNLLVGEWMWVWEGSQTYTCADGQEIPYDLWFDGEVSCADGSDVEFDPAVLLIFSPFILGLILGILRIRVMEAKILSIDHGNGTMRLNSLSTNLDLLWKIYLSSLLILIILSILSPLNRVNRVIEDWGHEIVIGVVLISGWYQLQQNREKDRSPEEITYVSLEEFHENLSTALGLSEGGTGNQEIRALSDSMGGELAIIRKRLEEHEEILTQIVVHYDHIYSGSTHWMGTSAVRVATEILLAHRLREILPNPSKETRTLANYRDQLKKHDSGMDSEVLRSIDVIVSLGNAAAHNMEATKQDYLSALQKFADVVEWHLSTPAKNVSGI